MQMCKHKNKYAIAEDEQSSVDQDCTVPYRFVGFDMETKKIQRI